MMVHPFMTEKSTEKEEPHIEFEDLISSPTLETDTSSNLSFTRRIVEESGKENYSSFEDGRITKVLFQKLQLIEFGKLIINGLALTLIAFQYEFEYHEEHFRWSEVLLQLVLLTSIAAAILTVLRYKCYMLFLKKRNVLAEKETLTSSGEIFPMLFEIFIVFLIPYPWLIGVKHTSSALDDHEVIVYHVNELLSLFSVLRLLIGIRVIALWSYWNSNRAHRLCEMYAVEPGLLFTIKCWMKEKPFVFVLCAYIASIPFFAWMLRMAERPFARNRGIAGYDIWNSMWNVLITMTTVGYGDYSPRTVWGRSIVFFVCVWGTIVISLMVVTITSVIQMNLFEKKTYLMLKRLQMKERLQKQAARIVTNVLRGHTSARYDGSQEDRVKNTKIYLKKFKAASREYRDLSSHNKGFEDIGMYFEFILEKLNEVSKNQSSLAGALKETMATVGVKSEAFDRLITDMSHTEIDESRILTDRNKFFSSTIQTD